MKSVMKHMFSAVPTVDIQRSKFDRSCGYKTTFDSGYLIPFYFDEVLPGDTFDVNATIFGRLSTPIVPFMDNLFIDTFFFFVPNRLIWSNWEKLMGQQDDPGDSTDYLVPIVEAPASTGFAVGSLFDYLGVRTGVTDVWINSLFPRAYLKIYDDWFRDENLQNSVFTYSMFTSDGPDSASAFPLLKRGKRHDYFTSCLPWPMKPVGGNGSIGVSLPLGTTAPVYGDGNALMLATTYTGGTWVGSWSTSSSSSTLSPELSQVYQNDIIGSTLTSVSNGSNNQAIGIAPKSSLGSLSSGLYTDLTAATAATINSLRQAFQLQKFYEKDARGGTRYIEKILAHFGVKSPDARLQRSEYLGGSSNRININQVEQNSGTNNVSPLGTLGAYGIFASSNNGFSKSFVEHGVLIGLVNVRADLTYQQGIERMLSRRSMVDFYWPTFAHLGEQAVLNKEIYAQGSSVVDTDGNVIDDKVFGYQERYAEYRYKPSKITGKFRSDYATSLDVWHLSQDFQSLPTLSSQFIEENPPLDRVLAVQNEPQILFDSYIQNICIRPMPVYSVPGLVDHF